MNRLEVKIQAKIPLWQQLRWNLVISLITLAVLPVTIISIILIRQSARQAEDQVISQLESVATLKEQELARWIISGQAELHLIVSESTQREAMLQLLASSNANPNLTAQVNAALSALQSITQHFEQFLLFTPDGRIVAASEANQIGKLVSLQPYFAGSMAHVDYVHQPYYEIGSGQLTMFETTQIKNDAGKIVGALAARLDLSTISEIMNERTGLGDTGQTYLVSREGNFLLSTIQIDSAHRRPFRSYGIDESLAQREGSGRYANYRGVEVFGVYHWIPDLEAALIAEQSVDEALTTAHESRDTSIMIGAMASLLAGLTGFFLATRLSRPIYQLTRSVAAMQRDFSAVEVHPPARMDEVGRLTLAFIAMRNRIQDLVTSLEERIQHLEAAESALATSEQKYRGFIAQAFEGIRLIDQQGFVLEWNPSMEQITGIPASEAINRPLWESQVRLIPPDLKTPAALAAMQGSFDQYFPPDADPLPIYIPERRIQRPDGTIRFIENIVFPIVTSDQVYYGAIIRDITAQKEDQLRLAQHVRKLEAMQRIAVAIGISVHLDDVLDTMLDQLATLIPYDRASIMLMQAGRLAFTKWRNFEEALSREAVEAEISLSEYMTNDGQPVVINDTQASSAWKNLSKGDELINSWMGVPLIHRDTLLGVLNLDHQRKHYFNEDHVQLAYAVAQQAGIAIATAQLFENLEERVRTGVQELQMEQERSNIILGNIADAIVFTDGNGLILFVNKAWENLNGYSLDEVRGQRSNLIQSGETPRSIYQGMWATISSGKRWKGDLKNKRKDGSTYIGELTVVPVLHPDGQIEYYVGVLRDVTALRELDSLKQRFVADAAHDLGNPVSVLNNTLYMLRRAPSQFDQRLPVLEHQVQRLDALIKDLLTIARLDREQELQDLAPIQLAYLVKQIIDGQQMLASHKQITLTHQLAENVATILGDVRAIERVIVNLVTNALTYTPEGGSISITVAPHPTEVLFAVKDSGIGIPPHELSRIFDRFYRGDEARQKTVGTGLGLPIVKKIVELHGGRIEVESELGRGSEFRVYFPIQTT